MHKRKAVQCIFIVIINKVIEHKMFLVILQQSPEQLCGVCLHFVLFLSISLHLPLLILLLSVCHSPFILLSFPADTDEMPSADMRQAGNPAGRTGLFAWSRISSNQQWTRLLLCSVLLASRGQAEAVAAPCSTDTELWPWATQNSTQPVLDRNTSIW